MTAALSSSADSLSRKRARARRAVALMAAVVAGIGAAPGHADLRMCNLTTSRVGISLGYRDPQGWVTEGWWNLNPRGCETLLKGASAPPFFSSLPADYD